jgi:hypothetical protein
MCKNIKTGRRIKGLCPRFGRGRAVAAVKYNIQPLPPNSSPGTGFFAFHDGKKPRFGPLKKILKIFHFFVLSS